MSIFMYRAPFFRATLVESLLSALRYGPLVVDGKTTMEYRARYREFLIWGDNAGQALAILRNAYGGEARLISSEANAQPCPNSARPRTP